MIRDWFKISKILLMRRLLWPEMVIHGGSYFHYGRPVSCWCHKVINNEDKPQHEDTPKKAFY